MGPKWKSIYTRFQNIIWNQVFWQYSNYIFMVDTINKLWLIESRFPFPQRLKASFCGASKFSHWTKLFSDENMVAKYQGIMPWLSIWCCCRVTTKIMYFCNISWTMWCKICLTYCFNGLSSDYIMRLWSQFRYVEISDNIFDKIIKIQPFWPSNFKTILYMLEL